MARGLKRRSAAVCAALALMSGLAICYDAYRIYDAARFNLDLEAGRYSRAGEHASLHGRLASAYALQRAGQLDEAVERYAEVDEAADQRLEPVVVFNLATLYLGRAMASAGHGRDVSLPLIELAKESYRKLLREDSDDWDAKYNLELAIRLSPEPDDEPVEETVTPERTPRAPRAPLGYGGLP
jgi:mxaK protein